MSESARSYTRTQVIVITLIVVSTGIALVMTAAYSHITKLHNVANEHVADVLDYREQVVGLENLIKSMQVEDEAFLVKLAKEEELADAKELSALHRYIAMRNPKTPSEVAIIIADAIRAGCEKYKIGLNLAVGLADVESTFNPSALSSAGARGLYQVMASVWGEELGITNTDDLYNIGYNVDKGLAILRHYIDKNKGDINKALKNYNGTKKQDFPNTVYTRVGRFVVFKNS